MKTTQVARTLATAALLAGVAGSAVSAAPFTDNVVSDNFSATVTPTAIYGMGTLGDVTITVPLTILSAGQFLNQPNVAIVDGEPLVSVSTSGTAAPSVVLSVSKTGTAIVWQETDNFLSNNAGKILSDGAFVARSRFNSFTPQNNIEAADLSNFIPGSEAAPLGDGGTKLFQQTDGIDVMGTGGAFVSIPSFSANGANYFVGQSNFSNSGSTMRIGVSVWSTDLSQFDMDPQVQSSDWHWPQFFAPDFIALDAKGMEIISGSGDRRFSVPNTFTLDCGTQYCVFGYGISGGGFSGGSAAVYTLVVDELTPGGSLNNWSAGLDPVFVDADGDASLDTTDLEQRFSAAEQGNGSASDVAPLWDVNDSGVIAIVHENGDAAEGDRWEVRRYTPTVENCEITGYTMEVIASTDPVGGVTPGVFVAPAFDDGGEVFTVQPFGGVSIDNAGNIAFTGVTAIVSENPDGSTDDFTTGLFYYANDSSSLFQIATGGTGGDLLSGSGDNLVLGSFPIDRQSDAFSAWSLSDEGNTMALAFRPGSGGGTIAGGATNVRGVAIIEIGEEMMVECPGDANGDNAVDLADLNLVLGNFGMMTANGDTNGDNMVDLADLNLVLGNFGTSCN